MLQAPRVSYEEWKLKQKEAEGKLAAVAENEERNMRESWLSSFTVQTCKQRTERTRLQCLPLKSV